MAKYLSDIVAYFRHQCEQHPSLQHAETVGQRVFEVAAYEQAFGDFRSASEEKGYFVRLIQPTMGFESQGNNALKTYQGGLLVGRHVSRRESDKAALTAAQTAAETVADDIIAKMVADSRNGHPLFSHSIDQIANLNVQGDFLDAIGDGSYTGVIYLFDFRTFRGLGSACSVVWGDGGLTPF